MDIRQHAAGIGAVADTEPSRGEPRRRRPHALRACVRCRQHRIKCGDTRPCRTCLARGVTCQDDGGQAQALTNGQGRLPGRLTNTPASLSTASSDPSPPMTGSPQDSITSGSQMHGESYNTAASDGAGNVPSLLSSDAFIRRLQRALVESSVPVTPELDILDLARTTFTSSSKRYPNQAQAPEMDRSTEQELLHSFVQSYVPFLPILDPQWLRGYHNDLWEENPAASFRKDCPLIDIILALSVQVTVKSMDTTGEIPNNASTSSTEHLLYERSQLQLITQMAPPTLWDVQSHFFAAVYLLNISQTEKAHQILAIAARSGHLIGLHNTLGVVGSPAQAQVGQRTWAAIAALDSIMAQGSDLPYLVDSFPRDISRSLLVESPGDWILKHEGLSYVECFAKMVELASISRKVAEKFNQSCRIIAARSFPADLSAVAEFYEAGAAILKDAMKPLREWVDDLPELLKTSEKPDKGGSQLSAFEVDYEVPHWLHRQRYALRIFYHGISMVLLSPYTCLTERFKINHPKAAELSVTGSRHAIALTRIIQETLRSDSIFVSGEACQIQWRVMLILAGYVVTHPTCPNTPVARNAMVTAMDNFQVLARWMVPQAADAWKRASALSQAVEIGTQAFLDGVSGRNQYKAPLETLDISQLIDLENLPDLDSFIVGPASEYWPVDPRTWPATSFLATEGDALT